MQYTDTDCLNGCKSNAKKKDDIYYNSKRDPRKRAFYDSKQWKSKTHECKSKFNGLDIFELYENNKLVPGDLSHHIIEYDDGPSIALELDNLIYVSHRTHKKIHKAYNKNKQSKSEMQERLRQIIVLWEKGHHH
jgi:hypothetical protein